MKITICGSSAFRKEKVDLLEKLKKLGHEPIIHPHYIESVEGRRPEIADRIAKGEHADLKIENDYIMWYYEAIISSDAVLIVNLEKNGQENYIGGNVFLEMGFAYVNKKKIFILNNYPSDDEYKYLDEILAMQPVILGGDLEKIK